IVEQFSIRRATIYCNLVVLTWLQESLILRVVKYVWLSSNLAYPLIKIPPVTNPCSKSHTGKPAAVYLSRTTVVIADCARHKIEWVNMLCHRVQHTTKMRHPERLHRCFICRQLKAHWCINRYLNKIYSRYILLRIHK